MRGIWRYVCDGGRNRPLRLAFVVGMVLAFAVASVPLAKPVDLDVDPNRVVAVATAVMRGRVLPGWDGGRVPYAWGGGHARRPGPSLGTCLGYRGKIRPCPAEETVGLDCSGLVRWVYHLAYGDDVLGGGTTNDHIRRMQRVSPEAARPGDLVFYGKLSKRRARTHHSGIYVGGGRMINALRTGTKVRLDEVTVMDDLIGYYRLKDDR
ncbi:NlpC/P60 family protein [Spongiactinospora sp. TRM90649]|uniref:C40 family peptidase n=1 Tax=Spongiactinospora sp. TRM90649 TaxID=3031114 RepID=UPI0023F9B8B7|nr:NlpC/P60 family protein [Spongiactinospora sp. TRM90649]MDF5751917.1 NlpC/P60 family protein [Spongiactinospora sp. TRM90649]